MIWLYVLLPIIFMLIVAGGLFWAFKTAFVRNDKRLISLDSDYLVGYKHIFKDGLDFIDNLESERVYIKSFDGLRLAGSYYNNNSDTTILLFHGYRSDGRFDFACAVKYYIKMGLNVLVVDQRANGESEGKLITFGIKERRDVVSWSNFINKTYLPRNMFLSGVSMGATTVMMASNLDLPQNVKGIIADCGFTSAPDIIKKVAKQSFKINATPVLPILDIMCKFFGKFSLYETTTQKALSQSEIPIFFIHGKKDGFVPCEMTELSHKAAKAEKYIYLVENADHGISFLVDSDNIQRKIAEFIKKCCS
ncbi:MAG: alpha/beta hydrolase [Clostridia bacterium]|nr:alpha/beta hydrolase [Clostridia bacterium]